MACTTLATTTPLQLNGLGPLSSLGGGPPYVGAQARAFSARLHIFNAMLIAGAGRLGRNRFGFLGASAPSLKERLALKKQRMRL
jgi:hypothetical protein